MYENGNWEQGRAVCFMGIHNSNLLCSAMSNIASDNGHSAFFDYSLLLNIFLNLI
jgi:hypothetical protein